MVEEELYPRWDIGTHALNEAGFLWMGGPGEMSIYCPKGDIMVVCLTPRISWKIGF